MPRPFPRALPGQPGRARRQQRSGASGSLEPSSATTQLHCARIPVRKQRSLRQTPLPCCGAGVLDCGNARLPPAVRPHLVDLHLPAGLLHAREAVLIDPVFEQARRDAALINELGLKLHWTLETHVHADHVTGAWLLKQKLGSQIALAAASGASGADRLLNDGDQVAFGRRLLEVRCHARPHRRLRHLRARRREHGLHGRLPADPRLGPHRLPAGRPARALPLGALAHLLAARDLPALSGARLSRAHGHQRRRGEALQSAPGRRGRRGRLCRLHEEPRPAASQEDRRGGAGQPALRPAGQRERRAAGSELGAAARSPSAACGRSSRTGSRRISARCRCSTCASRRSSAGRSATFAAPCSCPWDSWRSAARELPRDKPIVAVCRAGSRSAHATVPSCRRRALPTSPTCRAACCAGAPKAVAWKAVRCSHRKPELPSARVRRTAWLTSSARSRVRRARPPPRPAPAPSACARSAGRRTTAHSRRT